ncbi:glycogen debranching N-terminal domain-containing protein [Streptomyces shaanxiensis]
MTDRHHLLVHGGTFAAVGDGGDISGVRGGGSSPDGLFVRDARHLSRWQLTVDGAVPETLSPVADGDTARCVLVPRGGRQEPPAHTLFREQAVGDGSFVESLRVTSNRPVPTTVRLAVTADADFTDQFELRSDYRTYTKTGATRSREVLDDGVEFTYQRREWRSCTTVTADPAPDGVEETGTGARRLVWTLDLEPHGSAELTLRVMARPHGDKRARRVPSSPAALNRQLLRLEGEFVEGVAFPTGWPELAAACARGLADLASLQVPATGPDGEDLRVPAAGAPWFLTLLGRDALLTSLFALPYRPQLAAATLPALAATQATETGAASVAQPGKIVHEVRHGELAHFGQVPYGRYYGSVDATPLFLVLLGAYVEQTGDASLARRLETHARAAIGWMLDHGGLTSRGYLVWTGRGDAAPSRRAGRTPRRYCGLDKVYNAFQLGYQGPKFSWSTMPDQYALEAYQKQVHGKKRTKPLMSEIILTSSHQPWAPIPKMVDWNDLGDGSVFKAIQKAGNKPSDIIANSTRSKQEYGKSISYSVTSLTQWLERYGTDDTVLVFLGDHQPIARVSGENASRDVPISIVAKDPKVLSAITSWNWTDGLKPAHNAPVWKMSAFRDRFLTAYGSTPHPSKG